MIACPLCKKLNEDSTKICSCGNIFVSKYPTADPVIKEILERTEKRFNALLFKLLVIVVLVGLALYAAFKYYFSI